MIHVGLIGFGLGGATFHAPLVSATPGMRLAAIVTRDPERRAQARAQYPGARLLDHPKDLWASPGGLDLVVVSSPNSSHHPLALEALGAGMHVVVDKPFAGTARGAGEMAAAAARAGRLAIPFQNRRWDGDFLTVQRLLRDGTAGEVHSFESRFERWRESPKARWCEPGAREHAEGILLDIGSHLVDQALVLFGPVAEVAAETARRRAGLQVEDEAFISLLHANGVRSHLVMSASAAQPGPRITVRGSGGAYLKYGLDPQEEQLKGGLRPGQPGYGMEPEPLWGTLGFHPALRAVPTERGRYDEFYAAVARAVQEGAAPPVAVGEAAAGLRVIEAALVAADERRVVSLAPTAPPAQ